MNEKTLKEKLLNILFPRDIKCLVCKEELSHNTLYSICDICMDELPFIRGKICLRCGQPLANESNYCLNCKNHKSEFKASRSVFLYRGAIRRMIKNLKYDNMKYLAKTFGNFIASEVMNYSVKFDVVIPVPLSERRKKIRGYNQAYLLCGALKDKLHLDVREEVLLKTKHTSSQAYLSVGERRKNLENSFKVSDKTLVKGKTILLVDDIYTTGSTLNECAKTLKKAGAKEVYCVTLAHADFTHKDKENNK